MPTLPSHPVLVDLYCGEGGWTAPALARGWKCIGYDTTDHGYPGTLIRRPLPVTVAELAAHRPTLIVASPPCEDYARAWMPWLRMDKTPSAEAIAHLEWAVGLIGAIPGVPVVVECSRFAAKHVPGARLFGSYALWGAPALCPVPRATKERKAGRNPAARARIPLDLADWILDCYQPRAATA